MTTPVSSRDLARASIKPPPAMQGIGTRQRVAVYLRATDDGRFRWYREDGSPTVVDGSSIEKANRAAELVWRSWDLKVDAPSGPERVDSA